MRWPILAISLLLLAATTEAASVRVRLIRASNQEAVSDPRLDDIAPKLKAVFGYTHYDQQGIAHGILQQGKRLRLYPGEGFTLFVRPKSAAGKVHELEVELYSGKVSVTKATVKIAENSSILINGPEVGATLIIISMTVLE